MSRRARSDSGYTLVELMLTVALIGVMSAIAIPNFLTFQARSRRAEATTNLTALATAYKAFFGENNYYPDITDGSYPGGGMLGYPDPATFTPTTKKMDWPGTGYQFFGLTGFQADGPFYYQYGIVSSNFCGCSDCFTAYAYGDVDGDGAVGGVIYVHPSADPALPACTDPVTLTWTEPPGKIEQAVPVTQGPTADDF